MGKYIEASGKIIIVALTNYFVLDKCYINYYRPVSGFPPEMFERGWGSKRGGGSEVLPQEKKIRVLKFWCLKWPILTEMTVKYGKYFNFSGQQGGDFPFPPLPPPSPSPPPRPPRWRKPCV